MKSKRLLKVTFKLCRKPISLKIYYTHHEMTDFTVHQKINSQPGPASFTTNIDKIKYCLGPLVEIL